MPHIVRSARGEVVDVELLKIKQQLAEYARPVEVAPRTQFIDKPNPTVDTSTPIINSLLDDDMIDDEPVPVIEKLEIKDRE